MFGSCAAWVDEVLAVGGGVIFLAASPWLSGIVLGTWQISRATGFTSA